MQKAALSITGGAILGDVDTTGDVSMTAGTISGRLTLNGSLDEKKSVKLSGSAKIEAGSSNATFSAGNIDLQISGGTISAPGGHAVYLTGSQSRIYLSGSPAIDGGSADIKLLPTQSADDAVLTLHAKDAAGSAYMGGDLSISLDGTYYKDRYVAQGVSSAETAAKFSLVGLSGYYLAYDETNKAIQIKKSAYTVTLPDGQSGYAVAAATGSASPVEHGGSYSFTVTIADGYYKTDGFAVKANNTALTPDADGVYTIANITANQAVTVEGVALDETAPAAQVKLGTNTWNTFLNNITFGLFFKQTRTVAITASDDETGVAKTEYYISDTAYATTMALEAAVGSGWQTYSGSFSIAPNSKNIIYARATDGAGNVAYASSPGVVLYTDAAQDTQSISFTKTGTANVTANVALNGNTIDEIYCGSTLLTAGTDYTADGGAITFLASWLDTLSAGDYTLTVHYNPLGVAYVSGGGNDAPAATTIALRVQKAAGSVTITNDISKVYDGSAVANVAYQASSTGAVTVEYKAQGADDSAYTTAKPSAVGQYTVRVTVAADDDYPKASATADFAITYLAAPSPSYTLRGTAGANGWYTSDVTIAPPDGYTVSSALSGVASIRYYRSGSILTQAQVAALADADWTAYADRIAETAEDAKQFIYYVKITDTAGNATCFASTGATFDLTAPVISGVTDRGEYYTTKTVRVTDDHLAAVTLNGQAAGPQITLAGHVAADVAYTIVATDKAGNASTVTVTMKPTADLDDAIEGMEPGNVDSSDKEALEDYLDELGDLYQDESLTDAEKETILDLIDGAQDLLDRIEEAAQAAGTGNIQQAENITPDNVMPQDRDVLEAAADDIEQALEEYDSNYTEDEKAQLADTLAQIGDALAVIERAEDVETAIDALPERVSPDDTEAAEQIAAVKEQYDALSGHGQSLISGEAADKLNGLLTQLGDYRIIQGDGSTWTKGSGGGLTFVANGAYSKFAGIEIDGEDIGAQQYTADSGSTRITLPPSYLNALPAGRHTIAVLYTDGEARGGFTIAEIAAPPATGDESLIIPWIILILISAGAILTLNVTRRRKRA